MVAKLFSDPKIHLTYVEMLFSFVQTFPLEIFIVGFNDKKKT